MAALGDHRGTGKTVERLRKVRNKMGGLWPTVVTASTREGAGTSKKSIRVLADYWRYLAGINSSVAKVGIRRPHQLR